MPSRPRKAGAAVVIGVVAAWWVTACFFIDVVRLKGGESAGESFNRVIFADFFAAFLTMLFLPAGDRDAGWKDQPNTVRILSGLALVAVLLVGAWLLHDLGGWWLILPWMAGLIANWNAPGDLWRSSRVRVIWGFGSAFLVALGAAMSGKDPDQALAADPRGTAVWGMIYFGGLALVRCREVWRRV